MPTVLELATEAGVSKPSAALSRIEPLRSAEVVPANGSSGPARTGAAE